MPSHQPTPATASWTSRRAWAVLTLVSVVAVVVVLATVLWRHPVASAAVVGLLVCSVVLAVGAVGRRGAARAVGLGVALGLLLSAALLMATSGTPGEGLLVLALVAVGLGAQRRALRPFAVLPAAARPSHPVVVWNARSGGGKALRHRLADEARARGIEPLELTDGTDLLDLMRRAADAGADALAAAGGDGTQALVATVAAERELPFACIPAGTRNHFALDLGVDRDDVVGALDALVDGRERVVDLAEINGRVFVNNCSLGIYAEAVQREGYRDAKIRTMLDIAPDVVGPSTADPSTPSTSDPSTADPSTPSTSDPSTSDPSTPDKGALLWTGPDGRQHSGAAVILVSNNVYRLGRPIGSGTRPRLDEARLGVSVLRSARDRAASGSREPRWLRWTAEDFEVRSTAAVPVGIDGEALSLVPPLCFASRPAALRVRIAPHHPGASPSALQPGTVRETVALLWRLARGRAALPGTVP